MRISLEMFIPLIREENAHFHANCLLKFSDVMDGNGFDNLG